ncbi:transcription factor Adf-1-like [Gadus chalcogrammus]|uniref:transcription factor Adf-1-like n=1 Tax=Gadus chalcogrammus TaxID=1042646 RepID=UPI0024C28A87|nr:transcription factor Adf-1-like [Gadus chalcogrammus]
MEEKLIISVSAFPEIFNTTLASYKDRTVKTKAWLKVSEEVGLTEEECRRKWKVLRDAYLRERRRQEAGKRSGSAGPLKTWKYSAILSFLGPFVTPRETSSNMVLGVEVDGIAEYPVEDHGSEAAAGTASDQGDLSCEEPEAAAAASEPIPPPPPTAAVTTPPIAPARTQNRRRERETETEIERLLLEVLRRQTAPVPLILSEDVHFFKGILPSLQRLPPHAKEQVKFQIHINYCTMPTVVIIQYSLIRSINLDQSMNRFWGDNGCRE